MVTAWVGVDLAWKTCSLPGCRGASLAPGEVCLAHLDDDELCARLNGLARGRPLDGRGTFISPALLDRVIAAAVPDPSGRPRLAGARFNGAVFKGDASFDGMVFGRDVCFDGAEFVGRALFRRSTFETGARFAQARFGADADFSGAAFDAGAWFAGASVAADVSFTDAVFAGPARFADVTITGDAHFARAVFAGNASFDGASFGCLTDFVDATFEDDAQFAATAFDQAPTFHGAAFNGREGVPDVASTPNLVWAGPPPARLSSRAAAASIDLLIPLGLVVAAAVVAVAMSSLQHVALARLCLLAGAVSAVWFSGRNLAEQGRTGQSLGKRMMGLRLLGMRRRRPIGARSSIVRQLLHAIDVLPLPGGWLWAWRDPKRQTFADKILDTVVVDVGRPWHRVNRPEEPAAAGAPGCC